MPARKRKEVRLLKKANIRKIFVYLLLFGFPALSILLAKNSQKYWNGEDKLVVAIHGERNVHIAIFAPSQSEIVDIVIPENTQVDAAGQKGVFKIQKIWELGETSGLGGELLSRSISKHFKFPVYLWADKTALGFLDLSPTGLFKAIFYPYSTNLSFGDKLGLGLYSITVKNTKRESIDLSETSYLRKSQLLDGTSGFVVEGDPPPTLSSMFVSPEISQGIYRIMIRDATGRFGLAEEVSQVLEVLGGKVTSIVREKEGDGACEIKGKNKKFNEVVARILPCEVSGEETNFDIELYLGKDFVRRY